MPVLESTEFTTPRSALRHRPIGDEGTKPEQHTTSAAPTSPVQRASRVRSTDTQVEVDEWKREAGNASLEGAGTTFRLAISRVQNAIAKANWNTTFA